MKSEITKKIEEEREMIFEAIHSLDRLPSFVKASTSVNSVISELEVFNNAFWHILDISTTIDNTQTTARGTPKINYSEGAPKFRPLTHEDLPPVKSPMIIDAEEVVVGIASNSPSITFTSNTLSTVEEAKTEPQAVSSDFQEEADTKSFREYPWPFKRDCDMQAYRKVWRELLSFYLSYDVWNKQKHSRLYKIATDRGLVHIDSGVEGLFGIPYNSRTGLITLAELYVALLLDTGHDVDQDNPFQQNEFMWKCFIAARCAGVYNKDSKMLQYAEQQGAVEGWSNKAKKIIEDKLKNLPITTLLHLFELRMEERREQ